MADAEVWPPSAGLTTKNVPRKNAVLQVFHSTRIHAPAPVVFDTLLRVDSYPQWNTWVPVVRILHNPPSSDRESASNDFSRMRIGSIMEFQVVMDAKQPEKINKTPLKVVDVSTPSAPTAYLSPELLNDPSFTADLSKVYRVSWIGHGGLSSLGLHLERFHEVIVISDEECEVRTWEVMSGMLARVVKMMYQSTLNEKVALWCNDLKKYSEENHTASKQ